ncbi:MAG: hypothetical protein VX871_07460, partial [Pseudomonadota bacterium]|nr:hypothetical protein [Pseudomonadota bacterium]
MIQSIMLAALGFLVALLLGLLAAPVFWRRAVRLTAQRIESTLPMTVAEIQADKDQLRAEFAIRLRRIEMALEKSRGQSARHLVERNKAQVAIRLLEEKLREMEASLLERSNASTVLEQTVKRRIPELETRIERERDLAGVRDRELARLGRAFDNQTEALALTREKLSRRDEELEKLRAAVEQASTPAKSGKGKKTQTDDAEAEDPLIQENRLLQAQLS